MDIPQQAGSKCSRCTAHLDVSPSGGHLLCQGSGRITIIERLRSTRGRHVLIRIERNANLGQKSRQAPG